MSYNADDDRTEEQLFEFFSWIPLEITPESIFDDVEKLPDSDNAKKLGAIAIGAALNIKKEKIDKIIAVAEVTVPTNWNSIHIAMLGHLILHLPKWALTAVGAKAKRQYSEKLGEQKPAECAFLTVADWIKISNVGWRVNRRILSEKFPNLVQPPYNPFVDPVSPALQRCLGYQLRVLWGWVTRSPWNVVQTIVATFIAICLLTFGYTRRIITNILWLVLTPFGRCLGVAFRNSEVLKYTSLALILGLASIVVFLRFDAEFRLRRKKL